MAAKSWREGWRGSEDISKQAKGSRGLEKQSKRGNSGGVL
jgi:hypothetical protein